MIIEHSCDVSRWFLGGRWFLIICGSSVWFKVVLVDSILFSVTLVLVLYQSTINFFLLKGGSPKHPTAAPASGTHFTTNCGPTTQIV